MPALRLAHLLCERASWVLGAEAKANAVVAIGFERVKEAASRSRQVRGVVTGKSRSIDRTASWMPGLLAHVADGELTAATLLRVLRPAERELVVALEHSAWELAETLTVVEAELRLLADAEGDSRGPSAERPRFSGWPGRRHG